MLPQVSFFASLRHPACFSRREQIECLCQLLREAPDLSRATFTSRGEFRYEL